MVLLRTKQELREWTAERSGRHRVLVPTMGALHAGHASLMDLAVKRAANGDVLATIFVNPTQFGPNEDFDAYPRQLKTDLELCRDHGVTAVFAPEAEEMYFNGTTISVHESLLSHRLCGASRPGHFNGVCTIVAKLFLLTQPTAAVFGEKDFQQLAVIRRMVRDLDFSVDVIGGPTVRESDGLAMSSRNAYLSDEQRAAAPIIEKTLRKVAAGIASNRYRSPQTARTALAEGIASERLARIDYVDVVDASTLETLKTFEGAIPRLVAAVFFGETRLIDNVGLPEGRD
ncbi:MAG: pantoate--beta-alanine ligase [Verrucomicrobiales bacterium]